MLNIEHLARRALRPLRTPVRTHAKSHKAGPLEQFQPGEGRRGRVTDSLPRHQVLYCLTALPGSLVDAEYLTFPLRVELFVTSLEIA